MAVRNPMVDPSPSPSPGRGPVGERKFQVYGGGKPLDAKLGPLQSWNSGDIDFDKDGSIFIRNPYLANAIEEQLKKNFKEWDEWSRNPVGTEPVLFKLTRDEGWSGPKQNMVC